MTLNSHVIEPTCNLFAFKEKEVGCVKTWHTTTFTDSAFTDSAFTTHMSCLQPFPNLCLLIYLSVYLPISTSLRPLSLSLCLSVSLVLCLSPSISLCLYNIYLAACPCVIFFCASLSVFQYLSVYLPLTHSIISISGSLSMYISHYSKLHYPQLHR